MNRNWKAVLGLAVASAVTSAAYGANSLAVNAGASLNNTNNGLEVTVDGSTNNVYVESAHPTDETHYRARFFLCPNNLDLQENKSIRIGAIGDDSLGQHIILFLRRDKPNVSTDQWLLNTWVSVSDTSPGTYQFGTSTFLALNAVGAESCAEASAPHRWIEVEFTAGSGADGQLAVRRLVYNGSLLVEKFVNSRNTDGLDVDNIRIGALAGSGDFANSATSYFFDEFESYR